MSLEDLTLAINHLRLNGGKNSPTKMNAAWTTITQWLICLLICQHLIRSNISDRISLWWVCIICPLKCFSFPKYTEKHWVWWLQAIEKLCNLSLKLSLFTLCRTKARNSCFIPCLANKSSIWLQKIKAM